MKIHERLALDITILTAFLAIFGFINGQNPFASLSIYLFLLAITLFLGTFLSVSFSSTEYSAVAIMVSVFLGISAIAVEMTFPTPKPQSYSIYEIGNTPQAEWQIQFFYNESGVSKSKVITFKGTSSQSDVTLKQTIDKWNKEHPQSPITNYYNNLIYVPKDYAEQHGYPLKYSIRR